MPHIDSVKINNTSYDIYADKADALNVNAAVGSGTKGVYIDANGEPTAMTYAVNKDVPADAAFTDTIYSAATASAIGLVKPDGTTITVDSNGVISGVQGNIDASKITTGTIDIGRLPAGALERLITVTNQAGRFALTSTDVQLGDTVKQTDTGVMYLVVDIGELDNASGYVEYTAGTASSVPWSGVTDKPTSFTPASHTHTASQITDLVSGTQVLDQSGTTYTKRSKIQFINATIEDDPTNDKTIVTVQGGGTVIKLSDVSGAAITSNKTTVIITWTDPNDVVIEGATFTAWAGTKVVRKAGSAPQDQDDGTVVVDSKVRNQYSSTGFSDTGLSYGTTYYYRFFPYTDEDLVTDGSSVSVIPSKEVVSIVPSQSGTLTYNGSEQMVTLAHFDSDKMTVTGNKATAAGNHTAVVSLKEDYCWSDGSVGDLDVTWTISKADPTITKSDSSVSLDTLTLYKDVTITATGTGALTVTSSDTSVTTVANTSGSTYRITAVASGTATITASVAESSNYTAGQVSISVDVTLKPAVATWANGTDAQISAILDAYYDGTLTASEIQSDYGWSVGMERSVSLNAINATGVGESHRAQTVKMVILDFEHDNLSSAQKTSLGTSRTKALITVQTKDCLRDASVSDTGGSSNTEHGYMNSSNTNSGGWTSCARRTWCNSVFYTNALPTAFKNMVKEVDKLTSAGNQSTTINTTQDKVFLPSEIEIFGTTTYSVSGEGSQYSYFATATNRYKLPKWNSSNVSDRWWERSPAANYSYAFCIVYDGGDANGGAASIAFGLAPACAL